MSESEKTLRKQLPEAMKADQFRLRRRLDGLRRVREAGRKRDALAAIAGELQASISRRQQRHRNLPAVALAPGLPVSERGPELLELIGKHQVVVVCGETGSGKTTQLPKLCLQLGRGVSGLIGHTQPRRIAARSVADRIAAEMGTPLGEQVGYKVRFRETLAENAYIKLMTDGILLSEIRNDRYLEAYDTLIIDEAHERSLNIDLLLGYLKRILPRRPDLKIIITSATIDPQKFARFFDCPIVEISGRTWPVETRYRPVPDDSDEDQNLLNCVDELLAEGPGDILLFLYGENEIRHYHRLLHNHYRDRLELMPLYSRISDRNQHRLFAGHGKTRVVLATNVAETSLTVPGIRYVIDSGRARISRYSYRSKIQRLPVEAISRASAEQRKGRCGRERDGVCIRLYSEQDYLDRPEFTEPEIQRANLAGVILQMQLIRAGDMREFPFPDPPDERYVRDGYRLLQEIGALDEDNQLTDIGRAVAPLPVDPRIGRILVAAKEGACLSEMLVIASFLVVQDPRDNSADKRDRARACHARFEDPRSDFVTILNLWQWVHDNRAELSRRRFATLCQENYLSPLRIQEWIDLWRQLREQMAEPGLRLNSTPASYESVHQALLHGYLSHIAQREEDGSYRGARGRSMMIHPSSGLCKARPPWILGAWITETSRVWSSCVAAIEPAWAEPAAGQLARREYLDPYWDPDAGQVYAFMNVVLYGLTIVARRPVAFGRVDPGAARDIFIRHALIEGQCRQAPGFLRHNLAIQEKIAAIEDKTRSIAEQDLDNRLLSFYQQHLPEGVCSLPALRKQLQGDNKLDQCLCLDEQALMADAAPQHGFPDHLDWSGGTLALSYRFEPGAADDGVSAIIPLSMLSQLNGDIFQWLVPGLLEEKISALLRSLPKPVRRNFVPVPQFARAIIERLDERDRQQALLPRIETILFGMTGVRIDAGNWQLDRLPPHLRFHFRLVDEQGRELASGRDLDRLQQDFRGHSRQHFSSQRHWELEGREFRDWEFGELPETITRSDNGSRYQAWPCIADLGDRVQLQVQDDPQRAQDISRTGVLRLLMLQTAQQARYVRKNLPHLRDIGLYLQDLFDAKTLQSQLTAKAYEICFMPDGRLIRDQDTFQRALDQYRAGLVEAAEQLCQVLADSLKTRAEVQAMLDKPVPGAEDSIDDMHRQLQGLFHSAFLSDTPFAQLRHYPRYLQALLLRAGKLSQRLARDRQLTMEVAALEQRRLRITVSDEARRNCAAELAVLRWMIEELRVSLFAQELKTPVPISVARIEKYIAGCCLQRYL